jgi:biopolymer transport protein TolR
MASATPSGGGKRNLDMELNLVPFIDLLSCCIAFLMIVATWTQLARIDVAPSSDSAASEEKAEEDPLKLGITITAAGYVLTDSSGAALQIARAGTEYNSAELDAKLKQIRQSFAKEVTNKVNLTSEDGVAYKHLIAVMDVCLQNEFTGISVGSAQ